MNWFEGVAVGDDEALVISVSRWWVLCLQGLVQAVGRVGLSWKPSTGTKGSTQGVAPFLSVMCGLLRDSPDTSRDACGVSLPRRDLASRIHASAPCVDSLGTQRLR